MKDNPQHLLEVGFNARSFAREEDLLRDELAKHQKNPVALFSLASLYDDIGDYETASMYYRDVLSFDPYHEGAVMRLAHIETEGIDYPSAEKVLLYYLNSYPDNPSILNALAKVYIKWGHPAEAREVVLEVLDIDENNPTALRLLNRLDQKTPSH